MKIVVIGHGMVGHKFLESLVESGLQGADVTVLCEEPRPAYDRVHLSEFFAGKSAEDLSVVEPGFFERSGFTLRLAARAAHIERRTNTVTTVDGETFTYDKLVLATGSNPFVPPVPGRDRSHCFVYRTIEDLEAMKASGAKSKSGVVVGGGLLGLECAKALRDMGLDTHVVEFAPRLMAVQVDEGGGRVLRHKIEAMGLHVHTSRNTVEIVDGREARHRMVFADGSYLETDMIVFSAGIRPRDELARQCLLAVGARGGIAIDSHCRTSDRNVYAIGECAAWNDQTFGLVAPGYDMARVAAKHIAGDAEATFAGADMSTKLKLMGVDVASIGDAQGKTPHCLSYQYVDELKQIYKKIVVSADGKQLLGAVLVGNADEYGTLLQMALNGITLPADPEFLILPSSDGKAKPGLGVDALPDSAQICSCNNVSKGQIGAAVGNGVCTIAEIKACTKAGATCGGCVPLVTQVMKAEMAKRGMAVNNHLCEHFAYSRQELYHLIRVGQIKTFDELLAKHGKGLGCDVCKPTAASILASVWNDFVLKKDLASLQDSNDYFLGNIQKDGTYSVVPRMAGGEVTPDGLIAVAAGAGGHAGVKSPFALVQEIREWFDGPLALSGSIASGDAILAAHAVGADFAYIGSAFIATEEARAVEGYKQMIVESNSDDIVYSNLFTGVHGNYLAPSIRNAGLDPEHLPESDPSKMNFGSDRKAWKDIWGCGQGIGAVNAVVPTAELIGRLKREYAAARARLLSH